jgi:hypothetical protein
METIPQEAAIGHYQYKKAAYERRISCEGLPVAAIGTIVVVVLVPESNLGYLQSLEDFRMAFNAGIFSERGITVEQCTLVWGVQDRSTAADDTSFGVCPSGPLNLA